jgi:two-component system cell cycle sensor histidine kinase/response regulator CckA
MTKKKVLVVDNHPPTVQFIKSLLLKEGHDVVTANDGLSALDILQSYTPEVILMDLIMPNIDGQRLCRIIRDMPALQQARLIILSAVAAEETLDYHELGAHACIAKGPFSQMAEHILATMEQMDTSGQESPLGSIRGLDGVHPREITKELLSVKKHFELVLGSMAEGILEISPETRIIYANPVAVRLLGIPEEQLLGSSFPGQFEGEDSHRVQELLDNLGTSPVSVSGTSPLLLGDRQVALTLLPVQGLTCRAIVILYDVTGNKRLEVQLQQAQSQEAVGRLADGMAHRFSNVLTAIMGNLSLALIEANPEEKLFEKLAEAERAALKAKELVQELMALSVGAKPIKRVVPIIDLIKDVCIPVLKGTDIRCEFSPPPDVWPVEVDPGQFRQALYSLFLNAVEAMPQGGLLTVAAENLSLTGDGEPPLSPGKYLKLSIQDQGSGIAPQELPKIFDPNFTTKGGRVGLGLTSVYSIIQENLGLITALSELNVGTTFDIYLPAIEPVASSSEESPGELLSGKGRILVLDDDPMVRVVTEQMLEHLGYSVIFARDGRQAIDRYAEARKAKRPFDAVIIDVSIPYGMGGKETIDQLLKIEPKARVIASSGYVNDPYMSTYEDHGFADVLAKPYQVRELGAVLHRVVRPNKA